MKVLILLLILIGLLFSCKKEGDGKKEETKDVKETTKKEETKEVKKEETKAVEEKKVDELDELLKSIDSGLSAREKIVAVGMKFDGKKDLPESKKYPNGASGLAKLMYNVIGIDITRIESDEMKKEDGKWMDGIETINKFITKYGTFFTDKDPKPGDFIFFNNTYDKNKNGEVDDELTQIGIVTEVSKDGTVHFINKSWNGIGVRQMNLKTPSEGTIKDKNVTKTINSVMRGKNKKDKEGTPYVAGECFKTYGSLDVDGKKSADGSVVLTNKLELTDDLREKIAAYALEFDGKKDYSEVAKYKSNPGFIKMVYDKFGVDITWIDKERMKDADGKWLWGVPVLSIFVEENGEFYKDKAPKKGDIVIFDNVYDANKDGELNDLNTYAGIITDVEDDGTVHFVMNGYNGVGVKQMNLKDPKTGTVKDKNVSKTINSILRGKTKTDKEGTPYLSSECFSTFASFFK